MASAAEAEGDHTNSTLPNTTRSSEFLRSFSIAGYGDSDSDSDYAELSPIPETPGDLEDDVDRGQGAEPRPSLTALHFLPYTSIFKPCVPFSAQRDNCWIPGADIRVEIVSFIRQPTLKILNPNLYEIRVNHGAFEWTIRRRYKHFRQLHESLVILNARYRLPFPNRDSSYLQRRKTIIEDIKFNKRTKPQSVRFPLRPEALVSESHIPDRMKLLEDYLKNLLLCKSYRNNPETLKFFEVSHLSFVNKTGIKGKEGLIMKCSGGRRINIQCCGCLQNYHFAGHWNKRWLLIKDNFVAYVRPNDGQVSDVLLMDSCFSVKSGLAFTGASHGVLIENFNRKLLIKCWTHRKAREWAEMLENVAKTQAIEYTTRNRFGSFGPVRETNYGRWFVDGRTYFEAVADALEQAKEEIYIADWWLSPEIYLKRPIVDDEKWRLDILLQKKAEQGVKIFILLYKEIEAALGIMSIYSKQTLMSKNPGNIKVLRHPDHIPGTGVLLWAHHEKLVIIDQQIAFSGGLDLCYGRWDDESHRMSDLGSVYLNSPIERDTVEELSQGGMSSMTNVSLVTMEDQVNSETSRGPLINIVPPSPRRLSQQEENAVKINDNNDREKESAISKENFKEQDRNNFEFSKIPPQISDVVQISNDLHLPNKPANAECTDSSEVIGLHSGNSNPSRQPIEANIIFNPVSDDPNTKGCVISGSTQDEKLENSEDVDDKSGKQSLHTNDSEDFSESALEEIAQSMQPFKVKENIDSLDGLEGVLDSDSFVIGFNTSVDKEIVCSREAKEVLQPKMSRGKDSNVESKKSVGTSSTGVKAGHLWMRRSNKSSLELVMPNRQKKSSENGDVASDENLSPNPGIKVEYKTSNETLTMAEESKLRTSSNSSVGSAEPLNKDGTDCIQTPGAGAVRSFSHAAGALNALRKIVSRKEQNNNEDVTPTEESNDARRRWKLAFNVSKFDNIVRSPQVPERLDENIFYNFHCKPPNQKPKNKLVKSLKDGVEKFTSRGEHRNSMSLQFGENRNLLTAPGALLHTSSQQDILERGLTGSTKLWIGKDYVNFIYKDFVNLDQPFEDFIERNECPRMPWHDIGCVVYGKAARDLARHFIGRWNFTKLEKCKKNPDFPLLVPKTTTKCHIPQTIRDITFEVKVQVLRSSSGWSAGIGKTENSIHDAYEHCIENSRDFIYIENQFFITQTGNSSQVSNRVGNALYKRILRAHRSGQAFKVYVVMPLLPAFEGEFGTNTGAALQAVTHWNYSSICRGGNSLMEKLAMEVPDPNNYIVFCGLRTWDILNEKMMTELIYVHSKLMIVDDDTVIIGSANINDRSMLGHRDSEIAVMFEDVHKVDVDVSGKKYQGGKFASSLRWTIFREHLGLNKDPDLVDLTDITCDNFYKNVWIRRAAVNTKCYDTVFHCLPTDYVKNFSELREYQSKTPLAHSDPKEAKKWMKKVKGYLVLIPLQFLKDESLTPKVGQKEALLPTYLWT